MRPDAAIERTSPTVSPSRVTMRASTTMTGALSISRACSAKGRDMPGQGEEGDAKAGGDELVPELAASVAVWEQPQITSVESAEAAIPRAPSRRIFCMGGTYYEAGVTARALAPGLLVHREAEMKFDGVRVGPEAVLGAVGDGFRLAQVRLVPARLTHCMRWLGLAEQTLDLCRSYVTSRTSFGKLLAQHQMI